MQFLKRSEEGLWLSGFSGTRPIWFWELNLDPLQEWVLRSTEPSFQPLQFCVLKSLYLNLIIYQFNNNFDLVLISFVLLLFLRCVSPCRPGYPRTSFVDQVGLKTHREPPASECWDQKCALLCLTFGLLDKHFFLQAEWFVLSSRNYV